MKILIFVATLLLFVCSIFPELIHVETGDDFVHVLCSQKFKGLSTNIILNHSRLYNLTVKRMCVISYSGSLTIMSDNSSEMVNVSCGQQNLSAATSTVGFGFLNMNVTLLRVHFNKCGAVLNSSLRYGLNNISSRLIFAIHHSALLVFFNSRITVSNVNITHYYGFAIVAIDSWSSNFSKMFIGFNEFALSNQSDSSIGSGVMIFSSESWRKMSSTAIIFNQCFFYANFDYDNSSHVPTCITTRGFLSHTPNKLVNSAALTILFIGKNSCTVNVVQCHFERNYGTHAGGMLILMLNTTNSTVQINQSTRFINNNNIFACPGSALAFYMENEETSNVHSHQSFLPLKIEDTDFTKQNGMTGHELSRISWKYGAVSIVVNKPSTNLTFNIRKVTFSENVAEAYGSCLFSYVYPTSSNARVKIKMDSITVHNNNKQYVYYETGLLVFINVDSVIFNGSCSFQKNYGAVVKSYNSPVYLEGNLECKHNHAKSGAVFNIRESYLFISDNAMLTLINNSAEDLGGVINIINTVNVPFPNCAIQLDTNHNSSLKINSTNNTAIKGGNIIFAFPIYECYEQRTKKFVNSTNFYTRMLHIEDSDTNELLPLSSKLFTIKPCGNVSMDTDPHYPGETLKINVSVTDRVGNHVFAILQVKLGKVGDVTELTAVKSTILPLEKVQQVQENKDKSTCSQIQLTIQYHDKEDDTAKLYLFLASLEDQNFKKIDINLNLRQCPLGFQLLNGTCQCDSAVDKIYEFFKIIGKCDIQSRTIQKPNAFVNLWLGSIAEKKSNKTFGITTSCPIEFCFPSLQYTNYQLNVSSQAFLLTNNSHSENICRPHRKGVLCGECEEGYSVVFGTGDCMKCSNWWLLTILLYIISGPLLICCLYTLQLTLAAGTLNGIVFFAQVANTGILQAFYFSQQFQPISTKFSIIFLSLMNLNLGFSICFFNGMSQLWKTGLCLVYPIYLFAISAFLTVVSKHSSFLSKNVAHSSVPVLVTVIHLCISKVLIITIDVFSPIRIYSSNSLSKLVWYGNGSITFSSFHETGLVFLMVLSFSVTCLFLTPYLILVFGGRCLLRSTLGNKLFYSAYESIYSPYRDNRRYWFAIRVILLISVYLIFAVLYTSPDPIQFVYTATLPLLVIFLFLQVYLRPFKNRIITIVDSIVMMVLIILYAIGWYTASSNQSKIESAIKAGNILILLIFVLFFCIVIYHASVATQFVSRLKLVFAFRKSRKNASTLTDVSQQIPKHYTVLLSKDGNGSQYNSVNE